MSSSSDAIAEGLAGYGAGTAAAELVAIAAALAERVARGSPGRWPEEADIVTRAAAHRLHAMELVAENRDAYASAVGVLEHPDDNLDVTVALGRTLLVLRRIGTLAADVAELCVAAAHQSDPDLVADAVCATFYASSAARACAHLVSINLTTRRDDETLEAAMADADRAESAAVAAEDAGGV